MIIKIPCQNRLARSGHRRPQTRPYRHIDDIALFGSDEGRDETVIGRDVGFGDGPRVRGVGERAWSPRVGGNALGVIGAVCGGARVRGSSVRAEERGAGERCR